MRLRTLCPCRHYEDKVAEVHTLWNCPCVPMRERKSAIVCCFYPDNEFAGDKQEIPLEEIKAVRETM